MSVQGLPKGEPDGGPLVLRAWTVLPACCSSLALTSGCILHLTLSLHRFTVSPRLAEKNLAPTPLRPSTASSGLQAHQTARTCH